MKCEINKERLWIFSPVSNIVIKADISFNKDNNFEITTIKRAIDYAVNINEILKSRVTLGDDGKAYFVNMANANYLVDESCKDWQTIVKEQQKISFDIENGEYLRFYIISNSDSGNDTITNSTTQKVTLLIIAHHLAGDGTSFAYLLQDIMRAINGEKIEIKPVGLFDLSSLPKASRLGFIMSLMLKILNKQWKKKEHKFTFDEFKEMNSKYWSRHSTSISTYNFKGSKYDNLLTTAKKNRVSINTVITTAFVKAAYECGEKNAQDVGHAVSIRKKGYSGIGNFATGISMKYLYNNRKNFFENAKCIQTLIYNKINDDKKKYFLLQFMGNITGTLCDAIYFSAVNGYDNKTALTLSKMFGYNDNPKGISITNLTRLPIENTYGNFEITDFVFVPPLVINAKRIIGIASIANKMEISFSAEDNINEENNVRYFKKAISILESLAY